MLSQEEERNASSSSALLYHLGSESNSAQRKRRMTRTVVVVMALALAALVASSMVGTEPKRGLDVSMKVATQEQKQGSSLIKENYVKNPNPPPCAKGRYRGAGETTCYPCPKGYKCEKNEKTRCEAGEYQDLVGQTKCKNPGCGYYVPTAGSSRRYACRTGFYQKESYGKATQCVAASEGYFVRETSKKCDQVKCPEGTYQDCKGQGSCMKTPCGHYAPGTGNTKPKKCAGGEYQDKEGKGRCKKARVGHYALQGACHDTECKPGRYQPKPGQKKCVDAKCGTYVAKLKQIVYRPCGKGTYQPESGARRCLPVPKGAVATKDRCKYTECKKGTYQVKKPDGSYFCKPARCGYYVGEDGQDEEKKCPVGTYQPKAGQSECLDVEEGYKPVLPGRCKVEKCPVGTYKPGKGRYGGDKCTPCPAGQFQYKPGQSKCLEAPCGTYVGKKGQSNATPCRPGRYQKKTGQTSCLKAGQGKYAPGGGCKETPCPKGTYTDKEEQAKCKDADCGYFVAQPGSGAQTKCGFGQYQPLPGQASCLKAPKGAVPAKNKKGEDRCDVKECEAGKYQPKEGQETCKEAECGYYVGQDGSAKQFKCPKGRYALGKGNTKCTAAKKGQFVADGCKVEDCPDGTYSDCEGQTECYPVPCGHMPKADKTGIVQCAAGTYQDVVGSKSMNCKKARKGHYTDGPAYCFDEPCERGSYQPLFGQKSCKDAACGHFVNVEGATSQRKCLPGSYQPETGSVGCLRSTIRLAPGFGMCKARKPVVCTLTSTTDVSGTKIETGTAMNGGACRDRCKKNTLCHCFRFSVSGYGYTGQCTLMKGCKDLKSYVPKGVQTGKCTTAAYP